ncbi:suppressor of Triplolethal [Haemaphysalis longicornis]
MAALVEGSQYGLSSQGNYSKNKTLIFVKLTDSALRSIEEYLKYKGGCSQKPSIQFDGNQGVITVPRPSPGGGQQPQQQRFGFGVSTLEKDAPQGSFECVQQMGQRALESLGCLLHKMQIHASEDSYEKTRVKMATVEQESKKNCTKVIKVTSPYVGRKVKVKRPQLSVPPRQPSSSPPRITFGKPVGQNHNSVSTNESRSGIVRRSYRDRVIHLLALRPYKKPELLARLMKEGIKEQDRKGLSAVLTQVAVLKDNSYCLARHAWNQVCDDWPYYTPEEQELVKRMRPQNLTPPSENGHHSPPAHNPTPRTSPGVQKREPCPEPPSSVPGSKRQRISLCTNGGAARPPHSRVLAESTSGNQPCRPTPPPNPEPAVNVPFTCHSSPGSSPDSRDSGDLHASGVPSATPSPRNSTNQVPEYVTKYVDITSEEQRGRYKADFNAEYEEYKALHSTLEQVSKRFSDLEDSLRNAREGTEQWNRVKEQIVREYGESKRDQRYQQARRKFQYLHDKLAHIKRLVMDYDSRTHNLVARS